MCWLLATPLLSRAATLIPGGIHQRTSRSTYFGFWPHHRGESGEIGSARSGVQSFIQRERLTLSLPTEAGHNQVLARNALKHGERVLEVTGLQTHIRQRRSTVKAVDGVTLHLDAGETLGLVGESGCGKSMTAMSIVRLLPRGGEIVGGSIRLLGREVVELDEGALREMRGQAVGVVFQDPMSSLNPTMRIGRQIAESVRAHRGWTWSRALKRAVEVLELVGVPRPAERLNAYPHQLSGGLRQRVMIAIALANEPRLLIADEPTTALDVTVQAQILLLLDDLQRRMGMAVLLITHDLGVIAGHTDRVAVMYAGKIVEQGPTEDIFSGMQHPYTRALMDSIPTGRQSNLRDLFSIAGQPPDLSNPPSGCRFHPRCPFVTEVCISSEPALETLIGNHSYACFHPLALDAPPSPPASDRR